PGVAVRSASAPRPAGGDFAHPAKLQRAGRPGMQRPKPWTRFLSLAALAGREYPTDIEETNCFETCRHRRASSPAFVPPTLALPRCWGRGGSGRYRDRRPRSNPRLETPRPPSLPEPARPRPFPESNRRELLG